MVSGFDVEVLRRREPVLGDVEAGRTVPQNHEPVGVLVAKRMEQQRAGDAEHGGVRADSDRERQDGCCRERRTSGKAAQRIAKVGYEHAGRRNPIMDWR